MERETGRMLLENIKPDPVKVLEKFKLQLNIAPPGLRTLIDKVMASYAKRNGISYERVTKDSSIRDKVRNFFSHK